MKDPRGGPVRRLIGLTTCSQVCWGPLQVDDAKDRLFDVDDHPVAFRAPREVERRATGQYRCRGGGDVDHLELDIALRPVVEDSDRLAIRCPVEVERRCAHCDGLRILAIWVAETDPEPGLGDLSPSDSIGLRRPGRL